MKQNKYDCWVFSCKKCGQLLFIDKEKSLKKVLKYDCPECGEEPKDNWILLGEGNSKTYEWR